ncbi:MAG TPA: hypothetical protein VM370_07000 [Candidatus Thermoplasmatota archaeon]|nr:hypothetical protein [Candidatus Thermoplasmatota archaeon]
MDPRVAGAGVAMAIGMMLLLPTFNALNNSYVTDIQPPPWIPTPKEIPDDFTPPTDFTPPSNWQPPPDWEPPEGWEPPPGYDGPIPPGGCPPPVFQSVPDGTMSGRLSPQDTGRTSTTFVVGEYTAAIIVNATFTNWQAQRIFVTLTPPNGTDITETEQSDSSGFLVAPQAKAKSILTITLQPSDQQDPDTWPEPGEYTLAVGGDIPISGSWESDVQVVLPCGGQLQ